MLMNETGKNDSGTYIPAEDANLSGRHWRKFVIAQGLEANRYKTFEWESQHRKFGKCSRLRMPVRRVYPTISISKA